MYQAWEFSGFCLISDVKHLYDSSDIPVLADSTPAWISNYIHYNVWEEITYPFPNFIVQLLKFENGLVISLLTLLDMWLHIHMGIKVKRFL